jgi:hypothetical protein
MPFHLGGGNEPPKYQPILYFGCMAGRGERHHRRRPYSYLDQSDTRTRRPPSFRCRVVSSGPMRICCDNLKN